MIRYVYVAFYTFKIIRVYFYLTRIFFVSGNCLGRELFVRSKQSKM